MNYFVSRNTAGLEYTGDCYQTTYGTHTKVASEVVAAGIFTDAFSTEMEKMVSMLNKNLSIIENEQRVSRLTNEFYMLLDRLVSLKEKHPEISFEVDANELSKRLIKLSDNMRAALAYLFEGPDEEMFQKFCLECSASIAKPKTWLTTLGLSILSKEEGKAKIYYEKEYIIDGRISEEYRPGASIIYYVCIGNKEHRLKFMDTAYTGAIIGSFQEFRRNPNCYWRKDINESMLDDDYYYFTCETLNGYIKKSGLYYSSYEHARTIAGGIKKVDNYISEQNCKIMIDYLKEVYSTTVIKLLNKN